MENYTNQIVSLDYVEPDEVANIVREKLVEVSNDHVIFDVRDADEYEQGHVKGANSLPSENWKDFRFVQDVIASNIEKDTIVVHCFHSKQRGPTCARILADNLERYVLENPREKVPKV